MNYKSVRPIIRDGDVFSFAGAWRESRLIRWWTSPDFRWNEPHTWLSLGPASHVAVAIWFRHGGGFKRLCVMESVGNGVRMMPASELVRYYARNGGRVFVHPQNGEISGEATAIAALDMWGWEYPSSLHQYGLVACSPWRWLRQRFRGKDADCDSEKVTCSEFVATALQRAGHSWGKVPALVTPYEVTQAGCLMAPFAVSGGV
jgi:hypothetical protein